MNTIDLSTAFFEVVAAGLSSMSIATLWKHKEVKGVSLYPSIFFIAWGLYNIFFYTHVQQPISRAAGALMLVVNVTWFGMALFYKRNPGGRSDLCPYAHALAAGLGW